MMFSPLNLFVMKKNYKLYYATEENCFEAEKIGEFKTFGEAKDCLIENIKDDVDADAVEDAVADIEMHLNDCDTYYFVNQHEYECVYIITTDGRRARSEIAQYRNEMLNY